MRADEGTVCMTTALLYDPIFLEHLTPPGHPESPQRLKAAMDMLQALGWLQREGLVQLRPRPATLDELAAVHDRQYIASIAEAAQAGGRRIDADTAISPRSYDVARMAAGAALVAIDAIMAGEIVNAYALVRPPGHHATRSRAMGFCLFNHVAVAARYALDRYGLSRVLIVDYDVHHGNGTQDIFYEDPRVLYFSTHQSPLYPGTGRADETGAGAGEGTTVNVPLPAYSGWSVYDPIFRQVLAPLADRFQPEFILVSIGYDAHWKDPLASMGLDTVSYVLLTRQVKELAEELCGGRLILVQEGGYHLDAFAQCMVSCLNVLLGGDEVVDGIGPPPSPGFRWNTDAIVTELRRIHHLTGYRRRPRASPLTPEAGREEHGQ
jgi:acetoin utilization deacetylase AcuC-like enzyme